MPFQKLQFKPGINKEITKYTNEAGWNDCDKVRFRQGFPEKIGGWTRHGPNTFTGVCRSLHQWVSLSFVKYTGLGTNVKFMVETGQDYYDITPLRATVALTDKLFTVSGQPFVRIRDINGGFTLGSYVTFSGADVVGGIDINGEQVISEVDTEFTDATCDTTSGDATVTHDANARIYPGLPVSGTGIPANTFVASLNSSTSFELTNNATASNTNTTLTFDGTKIYKVTTANANATVNASGGGFTAAYQLNVGPDFQIPVDGWGSLPWDSGTFNGGNGGAEALRVWNQANYGEDLIIGPRGGELYYWDTSAGTSTRAIALKNAPNGGTITLTNAFSTTNGSKTVTVSDATGLRVYEVGQHVTLSGQLSDVGGVPLGELNGRHEILTVDSAANTYTIEVTTAAGSDVSGASSTLLAQYELSANVPTVQDMLMVSDASRFVFCFGCDPFDNTTKNPLLIRWSDQEDAYDWRPRSTNQAGDIQLSQGTEIVTAVQSRQEILVFTDSSLYSLQYVGAPVVWGSQLVGSNMSVASSKAVAYANGVAYWMGKEKFYKYDGTVQPLRCDVRKYVFDDLDKGQYEQVFAGTLEEYHEIWWFYCDSQRVAPNKYVVYNYLEDIWYIGSMDRSAWYDSPINDFPLAATDTYNLVEHENGNDDGQNATSSPINAYVTSGRFGIESGNSFTFVDKLIPDMSFVGSDSNNPNADLTILAGDEPGALDHASVGGNSEGEVQVLTTVDNYTDTINIRMRGREVALKIASDSLGTRWQLGTPRLNMRPDGRRGRS